MRTHIVISAICSAAIGLAAPATASQEQTNTVAKEKQAQPQQKKICKWLPATGSNRVEKHCLTAEDWKKAEALAW